MISTTARRRARLTASVRSDAPSLRRRRRIEQEIHVSRGDLVVLEIREDRHPSPVRYLASAHDDGCPVTDLADDLVLGSLCSQRSERWNCALQQGLGIRPVARGIVTDMAGPFDEELADA